MRRVIPTKTTSPSAVAPCARGNAVSPRPLRDSKCCGNIAMVVLFCSLVRTSFRIHESPERWHKSADRDSLVLRVCLYRDIGILRGNAIFLYARSATPIGTNLVTLCTLASLQPARTFLLRSRPWFADRSPARSCAGRRCPRTRCTDPGIFRDRRTAVA